MRDEPQTTIFNLRQIKLMINTERKQLFKRLWSHREWELAGGGVTPLKGVRQGAWGRKETSEMR